MERRIGFVVSVCGMAFLIIPLSRVLPGPDFFTALIGASFLLAGIYLNIESLSRNQNPPKK